MSRTPPETFRLLSFVWNVSAAKQLVADREPGALVSVSELWRQMGGMIRIDADHALSDQVDTSIPLIGVHLAGLPGLLVIDGWHRLYRAQHEGIAELPAHVLDEREERRVRLRGR